MIGRSLAGSNCQRRAREARVGTMTTHDRPVFGESLRRYRLAAGLTQEALARLAGLSARGIADLERGSRRFPYPDTSSGLLTPSSSI